MIYMVTWTSRDGEVHGVSASTLPEATTVYDALDYAGFAQVAVWNPKQVAVMVKGIERKAKGCTHPADEPCFSKPRLTSEGT